tara:strand:+ start:243 stop:1307 length:1065 start_codon:yes stop_codon:yes gene_type:complete
LRLSLVGFHGEEDESVLFFIIFEFNPFLIINIKGGRMISMKKIKGAIVAGIMLTFSVGIVSAADSKKPIMIPIHNWSSQVVMAYVIGGIFESMGNNVDYVPADSNGVYESIRLGDVTISHEVWEGAFGHAYYTAMEKGGLIEAGTHSALTIEDMGVPKWVIEQNICPGLPDWKALKGCGSKFAKADSGGKGVWLDGPWHVDPDTGKNLFEDRIPALGLDDEYTYKQTGSADALWAAIDSAKAAGEGIIIFNWTPNFTDSDGFVFIEFPPYFFGCRETEGGDGACGSPRGWLKKAANYKFPKTHPMAYKAFTKMDFNTGQIGQMAALVDIDKMSHKDAAKKWLAANEDVWKAFLK